MVAQLAELLHKLKWSLLLVDLLYLIVDIGDGMHLFPESHHYRSIEFGKLLLLLQKCSSNCAHLALIYLLRLTPALDQVRLKSSKLNHE